MTIDKVLLTKGNNSEYMVSRVIKFITFGVCDDKQHRFQGLSFLTIQTIYSFFLRHSHMEKFSSNRKIDTVKKSI